MKKTIIFFLTLLTVSLTSLGISASNTSNSVPEEAVSIAEENFNHLKYVFTTSPEKWGFDTDISEDEISLGKGYHISCLVPNKAENKSITDLIDENINDKWIFTANAAGSPITYVNVSYDGHYYFSGYGGDATKFNEAREFAENLAKQENLTLCDDVIFFSYNYYFLLTGESEFLVPAFNTELCLSFPEEKYSYLQNATALKVNESNTNHYMIKADSFWATIDYINELNEQIENSPDKSILYTGPIVPELTEISLTPGENFSNPIIYIIPSAIMLISGIALYCLNRKKSAVISSDGQTSD